MSAKAISTDVGSDDSQPADLVNTLAALEEGDEFQVFAGEFRVDAVLESSPVRPILYVSKKSVGGYMSTTYRLEPADPVDTTDNTLVIQADRKSGFDEWSRFSPDQIDVKGDA